MSPFSILAQKVSGAFTNDSIGGPIQVVLNAYQTLNNTILIADSYANTTRRDRLLALKPLWETKAGALLFYGPGTTPTAVDYANNLAGEVGAALAVND